MTRKEMYMAAADNMVYLASCTLNGITPDADRVDKMNLSDLHMLAEDHMMDSIADIALESAGVSNPKFMRSRQVAVARNALFNNELSGLIAFLENENIWYVLLKGAVIKKYYPDEIMRQAGDVDILFDETHRKKVRDYFASHGFKVEAYKKGKHDTYVKLPVYVFEMHVTPVGDDVNILFGDYYKDVKERLIGDEGSFGYHFSDEDMYIHMIAHEYNHYSKGGTGIRSLMDTYVYLNKFKDTLDFDYITNELQKLRIDEYEKVNRSLSMKLFSADSSEALDDEEQKMYEYIVNSGTYGRADNYYVNIVDNYFDEKNDNKKRSKAKYVLRRIFIPMRSVKSGFPFFYRHKIFMPFLIIFRIGRALTTRRKNTKAEMDALKSHESHK